MIIYKYVGGLGMKHYTVQFPNYTIGQSAIEKLSEICGTYGTYGVVIGGYTALEKVKEKLYEAISGSKLRLIDELWYGGECSETNIKSIVENIKDKELDFIIGVGGGRALDTAKAVANRLQVPIFTIPTIAATCAATTKLSVVYKEDGVFDTFYFYERPPVHVFIDTEVISQAPVHYLRAGMGDTLAKHYECTFASSGRSLDHNSGIAVAMSTMCVAPLLQYGEKAIEACSKQKHGFELEQVILANIVTTGLVSMYIEEDYNGAVAHSVFYGLTTLPHIEERYLHGDVVGYGVLVQLVLDAQIEEAQKLYEFYKKIGIPTSLKDIDVPCEKDVLLPIIENILEQPDMKVVPYRITIEMLLESIKQTETLGGK